ncbi:MAG: FAD-dependent oxidoreductase [Planctomycetia bacterium]|nr:FAD-dependent oxidoreductase [Planctomycetia bacterium]
MEDRFSRRDLLRIFGAGAAVSSASYFSLNQKAYADLAETKGAKRGTVYDGKDAVPCQIKDGKIFRPAADVPTIESTDVLVLGAGPAGCCAAIAAARAGVKVLLVERYNHFGGLATGGLVLTILGHWTKGKVQVCQGLGEEMMQRLEKMPYGIAGRDPGRNPAVDAEAYKYLLLEMITEAGVNVYLHSWATDAIVDGNVVKGAVIQTKLGPKAILAKQVIDTTGDGDIFASAGVVFDRRDYHIGLPHRLADFPDLKGKKKPRNYGGFTPIENIRWVNMGGKTTDGLDAKILSDLEIEYRKKIWADYIKLRSEPGFENVKMIETAPQLGVRITRVLKGVVELTVKGVYENQTFEDCVGIGGAWHGDHQGWQIPLRALLPEKTENLLTAGRTISSEPRMSDLIRVIPNCWVSGQGAGCAAACAVEQNTTVRNVDIKKVQTLLKKQNVYFG